MAGETPRQVVIGLLRQALDYAERGGGLDGLILAGVTGRRADDGRPIAVIFAAGNVVDAKIETALSDLVFGLNEAGWKQFYWNRIPQQQVFP